MHLRRATSQDIESLWAVRTAAIQNISENFYTKKEIDTWAQTQKPGNFEEVLNKLEWYVAEENQRIIGSGFLDKELSQIGAIFVDPAFQRKKVGQQILVLLEKVAQENHIPILYLEATINATLFYKAAGYTAMQKSKYCHVSGLQLDCVNMQKVIASKVKKQLQPHIFISEKSQTESIENQLIDFNNTKIPLTQSEAIIPLNFHFKDEEGNIIAGINACMYGWKMVYVSILFVNENYRHEKLGSRLLEKAESEAKAMGATLVHLDTFDFQAKDFYLKHGYEIFGVLEDCPPGHKRYYFKKAL